MYMYVCRFVYGKPIPKIRMLKCVGVITRPKHAHAKSQFWAVKTDLQHPHHSYLLYTRAALAWTENKSSLRNEKLKANRDSETEEQIKERLRIRRDKDRARRRTKKLQEEKKRSSETEDYEKQRLATLKRLK